MISLINAGPGTGKTRVLTMGYMMLSKQLYASVSATPEQEAIYTYLMEEYSKTNSICFFTHSNSSKDTLIDRIGKKASIYTFHGAGMSAIIKRFGYQKLVNNRTERHIETMIGDSLSSLPYPQKREWYAIKRILHYLKIEALLPLENSLEYLLLKYSDLASYSIPSHWLEVTTELFNTALIPDGEIEFADMVSMGKRAIQRPRFTLGLVDESQDVSTSTYQLVTRMCSHVVFCGDKNQAINAFAGASEEMYDSIASKSDAIFPMKQTYRCPLHVCDIANVVRPGGIVHGENNIEGVNKTITRSSLPEMLMDIPPYTDRDKPSCLFVSRTNATILSLALFMYKNKVPFRIQNKELHEQLNSFIRSFGTTSLATLKIALEKKEQAITRVPSPLYQQMMMDKITPVKELANEVTSFSALLALVKETFTSVKRGYIGTTIHGAKGMEAPNVFIIAPPIELPMCMEHPIAREQEINLHFVAVTRSSKNLYWVK